MKNDHRFTYKTSSNLLYVCQTSTHRLFVFLIHVVVHRIFRLISIFYDACYQKQTILIMNTQFAWWQIGSVANRSFFPLICRATFLPQAQVIFSSTSAPIQVPVKGHSSNSLHVQVPQNYTLFAQKYGTTRLLLLLCTLSERICYTQILHTK